MGVNDSITGFPQASSERLTIGEEYVVIELLSSVKKGISYRVVGDNQDGSPAVFSAAEFEIISDHVPTNWKLTIKKNGLIVNSPASWRKPGFWEDCYDHNPVALESYKREVQIIMEEENAFMTCIMHEGLQKAQR
jgi:hypothetical protein